MPVDKNLGKVRAQIEEIKPLLEDFFDQLVQPGVEECTKLQKYLCVLQEELAVYKHTKQTHEISPSFNLHAHISEAADVVKQQAAPPPEPPPPTPSEPNKPKPAPEQEQQGENIARHPLQIGLNDTFRFINELFHHNDAEYKIAMEQLSNLQTWSETELYLNSLKNLYEWRDNEETVKYFYSLVKKRFQ